MKRQQTKFHTATMSKSKVIRSKKSMFCKRVFSFIYFIKATTTHIDVLLQV